MKRKDELKEIYIKNRTCYYFDDIMILILVIFYWTKNHMKIFHTYIKNFIQTFHGYKTIVYLI